jgi:hypothetical protein
MAQEMGENLERGALLLRALPPPETRRPADIRLPASRNNTDEAPAAKHLLEPSNKVRFFKSSLRKCTKKKKIFVKWPTK